MAGGAAFLATTPDGPTSCRAARARPARASRLPIRQSGPSCASSPAASSLSRRVRRRVSSGSGRPTSPRASPRARSTPRPADGGGCPPGRRTTSTTTSAGRCNVDLNDLSRERWSLLPQQGDLIAEVRTKRFGNLTYARVQSDAEDVSFFDRRRKKNIAVYASQEKLATRGRFYSEDDSIDYDVHVLRPRSRLQPRAAVDRRPRAVCRLKIADAGR